MSIYQNETLPSFKEICTKSFYVPDKNYSYFPEV